jgi:two-component system, NarL family, response regulator
MKADPRGDGGLIRVVAIDDHVSYTRGLQMLCRMLSEDVRIVGLAETTADGLLLTEEHHPDIVLLDMRMPDREGVDAAKKICQLFPSAHVVMLSASCEPEDVIESMRAGARGYLTKDIEPQDLLQAIRTVSKGEVVLAPLAASVIFSSSSEALEPLTDAELHILKLLAEGSDVANVAKDVAMSESSLKRAIREIQRKLGVSNRTQAIVAAAKKGLI